MDNCGRGDNTQKARSNRGRGSGGGGDFAADAYRRYVNEQQQQRTRPHSDSEQASLEINTQPTTIPTRIEPNPSGLAEYLTLDLSYNPESKTDHPIAPHQTAAHRENLSGLAEYLTLDLSHTPNDIGSGSIEDNKTDQEAFDESVNSHLSQDSPSSSTHYQEEVEHTQNPRIVSNQPPDVYLEENISLTPEHRPDASSVDAKMNLAINQGKETENLPQLADVDSEDFDKRYKVSSGKARRNDIKVQAGFLEGSRLNTYYEITLNWRTQEVTISRLFSRKDTEKGKINDTNPLSPDKILENLLNIAKDEIKKVPENRIDLANFSLKKVIIDPIPSVRFDPDTKATVDLFVAKEQTSSQQGDNPYFGLLGTRVSQDIYPFLKKNLSNNQVTKIDVNPSWSGPTYSLSFSSENAP